MIASIGESVDTIPVMLISAALGLVLAIVTTFVAVSQVDSLQDLSKPITTGAVNQLLGGITFITLLLAVVVAIAAVGGVLVWAIRR